MTAALDTLRAGAAAVQRGDFKGALAELEQGLAKAPDDPALLGLAALCALRLGYVDQGIAHLRRQLEASPDDKAARFNLATALAGAGHTDEAADLAAKFIGHAKLARLAGYLAQQAGRTNAAISAYREAVRLAGGDWESWNNLGNCCAEAGDIPAAIDAFENAINTAPGPGMPELFLNLCRALAAPEYRERRMRTAEEASRRFPNDQAAAIELALAQAATGQMDLAEAGLRAAAANEEGFGEARLELGLLLENANRLDELDAHIAECEALGPRDELLFLKAWSLRRRDRFDEAALIAQRIPDTINPIRTEQLRAEIADRLGKSDEAFRHWTQMNETSLLTHPPLPGPTYRELTLAATAAMQPPLPAVAPEPGSLPDPVFIVGSPRSGTTLLDTLLTALPELQVFEELPMLAQVEAEFPDLARESDAARVLAARRRYFELAETLEGPAAGRRIVDKMPLHLTHMPVIQRLFPRASIVLVERHPCDAVLSCFMANFMVNHAMRSFMRIGEAALTYDAVFANWTRATELLPLSVHLVRYERMVADLESEMRPLLAFLGLEWRDAVLDNQASSAARGAVRTASYAQVGQPLYRRAAGRWERYRSHLEPVLPILRPWADRMGYEIPAAG
ncbi:MAG: sulfotransferase [Novosphingobium sp.]